MQIHILLHMHNAYISVFVCIWLLEQWASLWLVNIYSSVSSYMFSKRPLDNPYWFVAYSVPSHYLILSLWSLWYSSELRHRWQTVDLKAYMYVLETGAYFVVYIVQACCCNWNVNVVGVVQPPTFASEDRYLMVESGGAGIIFNRDIVPQEEINLYNDIVFATGASNVARPSNSPAGPVMVINTEYKTHFEVLETTAPRVSIKLNKPDMTSHTQVFRWFMLSNSAVREFSLIVSGEPLLNSLTPRQNGRRLQTPVSNAFSWMKKCKNFDHFSLTFVPKGLINNTSALIQITAWRRSGDKPLSEAMVFNLLTHICVTRSQWVKFHLATLTIINTS